ncbi:MAG: PHP domain-containing protein, partial [Candidatus Omnitrophota bacterium]
VHTVYSDGTYTPEEVVQKAAELNLKAIAITDHDCVDGISPAIDASKATDIEVIPGIEISAVKDDVEIHVLGYFIDWRNASLTELLNKMQAGRVERMRKMVGLLQDAGLDISIDKVLESSSKGTIGRLHLARIMEEEGLVSDTKEAFDKYIGNGKPCHARHKRLDYTKAIDMIKDAGGVPVLAHPGTMGEDEFLPDYVKAGLRGIEVYHSGHETPESDKYLKKAQEYGLIATGGSDCHGTRKGKVLIGRVMLGYDVVEKLREEAEKIRNA